ncbi:hypothetical protein KR026_004614 [Drosophila bipectinata]|nr:hypothetical protein KR026_004614 [Drosophila bipectinata]
MALLLHLLLHCTTTLLIANALVLTGDEAKSKGGFPIPLGDDVDGVELPMEVEQEVVASSQHSMPPAWLFDAPPAPPPPPVSSSKHRSGNHKTILKHPASTNGFHKLSSHGHRSCSVEIVNQVPGICQSMPMGSACVTDDYMVIYTDGNCSTQ